MSLPQRRFILHIDDDEDDRIMLKEAVKETEPSLDVWGAKNGEEGLEILMQCTLLNTLPSLIVLDLNMPGIDGKMVLQEIKKQNSLSSVPVAVLTTSSSELDKIFALKYDVKLFTKPTSESEFFLVIKKIIETCYKTNSQ